MRTYEAIFTEDKEIKVTLVKESPYGKEHNFTAIKETKTKTK